MIGRSLKLFKPGVELVGAEAAGHCYSLLPEHIAQMEAAANVDPKAKGGKSCPPPILQKHIPPIFAGPNKSILHDVISEQTVGASTQHSSSLTKGTVGILHGSTSLMLQTKQGQSGATHSISAGLDYSGVSPLHSYLSWIGRAKYATCSDVDAIRGWAMLARTEGILAALESSHAVTAAIERAAVLPATASVIVNLSGRGDKDMATLEKQAKIVEALDKVEKLRAYVNNVGSCEEVSYEELVVLAKGFLVDADLEQPAVENAVLNFFADFLGFMERLEDTLPVWTQPGPPSESAAKGSTTYAVTK